MSALEDLIVSNQQTYNSDLMGARAVPRDNEATSKLKADSGKMSKLAELAEVDADDIVDVAVRGANVSFMVKDADGAVSAGYFPTASLEGSATKAKRASGTVQPRTHQDPAPQGGAATVPTIVSTGGDEPEPGQRNEAPVPPPEGVPADIDSLSGAKVAELLKDTPEGVDAAAVWQHEQQREGGPRTAVERAAKATGLVGSPGSADDPDATPETT